MNEPEKFYVIKLSNASTDDEFAVKCRDNGKPSFYFDKLIFAHTWKTYSGAEKALQTLYHDKALLLSTVPVTKDAIEKARFEEEEKEVIKYINHLRDEAKHKPSPYNIQYLAYAKKLASLKPRDMIYLKETFEDELVVAEVENVSGRTIVVKGHNFSRMNGTCNDDSWMSLARIFPKGDACSQYLINFRFLCSKIHSLQELTEDKITRISEIMREP